MSHEGSGEAGQEFTLITGHIIDQPALHGLLAKIRDLNLTLISVRKFNQEHTHSRKEIKMSDRGCTVQEVARGGGI